jgi:hypothetical protein
MTYGRCEPSHTLFKWPRRDNAESSDLDLYRWHCLSRSISGLGSRREKNLRALLAGRLGLYNTFVNLHGAAAVDQKTEQFWPAVVAARVH